MIIFMNLTTTSSLCYPTDCLFSLCILWFYNPCWKPVAKRKTLFDDKPVEISVQFFFFFFFFFCSAFSCVQDHWDTPTFVYKKQTTCTLLTKCYFFFLCFFKSLGTYLHHQAGYCQAEQANRSTAIISQRTGCKARRSQCRETGPGTQRQCRPHVTVQIGSTDIGFQGCS